MAIILRPLSFLKRIRPCKTPLSYLSNLSEKSETCPMTSIKEKLMCRLADAPSTGCNKITIVGAGQVGMACAICILNKRISNDVCLIDADEKRVTGETLDLQHGSSFVQNAKITGGTDFLKSADSRLYIITAGVGGTAGESRLSLLERNANILKNIIPRIVEVSPNSIILMVTNPVDILTYLAWKLSGFPKCRVMGSGTTLDSARFRYLISQRLNVAPTSCDAFIIGEHGDSSVPVWSAVSVSGVNLRSLDECIGLAEDPECWSEVHKKVVSAANDVIKMKGYTNWAVALSCASIAEAILSNSGVIMPVSTAIKGMYGISSDVFLSMPCVLNANGITSVVKLNLTLYEIELLQKSAKVLAEVQKGLAIERNANCPD